MNKVNISAREKKILSILNVKHRIVNGKELATKLGVSERTIRSDISHINIELSDVGINIIPIHGKGYSIEVKDRATFLSIFAEDQNYITKEDRINTLLLKLLRAEDWYDLGVLEDEMYVSSTTLEKDIKALKKIIGSQHPYLNVERKFNSVRLEDDEQKKRDLFTRLYAKNWDYDSKDGIVLKQGEFGTELLNRVQSLVKETLTLAGIQLDDFAFIYLTLAIVVMIFRVKKGHRVNLSKSTENEHLGNHAWQTDVADDEITSILDKLKEQEGLELSEGEYLYLARIKRQLVFLCLKTYSKNFVLNNTDIECHEIVNNLLEELYEVYGIDFTGDDKLFVDLTRHVQALESGIVAPHLQNHVLGDELRKKNPFLGDIAHFMGERLSEKCHIALGKEEEDYLLPFIMLAEEVRYKNKRKNGIPTAVISHYNESMTHYLMEALRRYYGGILDLRGPYAMYSKAQIEKEDIRFVLTTVKMEDFKEYFNTPVLTVSPILTEKDQDGIDLYLTSLRIKYLYREPEYQMDKYFLPELMYRLLDKSNLTTAIKQIESRLKEVAGLSELPGINLDESYYCALSNGFMFCYQINNDIDKTMVSLVDFGKDLSCKYVRNIKTLMYMLMPAKEIHTLGRFYYMAMAFAMYPSELKSLFEGTSIEDMSFNISKGLE